MATLNTPIDPELLEISRTKRERVSDNEDKDKIGSNRNVNTPKKSIGVFKVATYFILIFYLIGFYCQIKISKLINRNIWHNLAVENYHLFQFNSRNTLSKK